MNGDDSLYQLAADCGRTLLLRRQRLALAESCTGGWIAKALTDVPGSSQWFEAGFVTYSNSAKQRSLGVEAAVLARHGAVSREVVEQMATGALHATGADVSLAVSGVAGPDGGTADKPVGMVWFATCRAGHAPRAQQRRFAGSRDEVRRQAMQHALELIRQSSATE